MEILEDLGFIGQISDIKPEYNDLNEDLKKCLAIEVFTKLRKNDWNFLSVCRLFKVLTMTIPSTKERETL